MWLRGHASLPMGASAINAVLHALLQPVLSRSKLEMTRVMVHTHIINGLAASAPGASKVKGQSSCSNPSVLSRT